MRYFSPDYIYYYDHKKHYYLYRKNIPTKIYFNGCIEFDTHSYNRENNKPSRIWPRGVQFWNDGVYKNTINF